MPLRDFFSFSRAESKSELCLGRRGGVDILSFKTGFSRDQKDNGKSASLWNTLVKENGNMQHVKRRISSRDWLWGGGGKLRRGAVFCSFVRKGLCFIKVMFMNECGSPQPLCNYPMGTRLHCRARGMQGGGRLPSTMIIQIRKCFSEFFIQLPLAIQKGLHSKGFMPLALLLGTGDKQTAGIFRLLSLGSSCGGQLGNGFLASWFPPLMKLPPLLSPRREGESWGFFWMLLPVAVSPQLSGQCSQKCSSC